MSIIRNTVIEVEARIKRDIKGRKLNRDSLVECILNMGFEEISTRSTIKTFYKTGDKTLHHLVCDDQSRYYYKTVQRNITSHHVMGFKTDVSIETSALPGDITERMQGEVHERRETLYRLNNINIYIREERDISVEIEQEVDEDLPEKVNPAIEAVMYYARAIVKCISFRPYKDIPGLYLQRNEYNKISRLINMVIKKQRKPVPLRWVDLTVQSLADYFLSRKADGVRVFLLVLEDMGVFILIGSSYDMIKISEYVGWPTLTGDVILEGELLDPSSSTALTSKPIIVLHDILNRLTYNEKISRLPEYVNVLRDLPVDITTKTVRFLGTSRQSIMNGIADTLDRCNDPFSLDVDRFETDGLIFTPNDLDRDIYKWKPVDRLTIDLMVRNGELVYGEENIKYEGDYSTLLASDNISHDNTSLDNTSLVQTPLLSTLDEGSIHEFLVHQDMSLSYVKPRRDRLYPNSYPVVQDMINLATSPITEDDLLGVTPGVYRKYHNRRKRDLLKQASRRGGVLLDIGSGKGGSLLSYLDYRLVIVVDPSKENMQELISRASEMDVDVRSLDLGCDKLDEGLIHYHIGYMDNGFLNTLYNCGLVFDVVSSFFTIQFLDVDMAVGLYDVSEDIARQQVDTLRYIIANMMSKDSIFLGISLDYKPDINPNITRESLCQGYDLGESEVPIALYDVVNHNRLDGTTGSSVIAKFNIPGLATLPFGHQDFMPFLRTYLSNFIPVNKLDILNITPLYANNLVTSSEWIDLSYYYSVFILAERRPVAVEITTGQDYLHVSSLTENSIHRSPLIMEKKPMYEVGVIDASLDACILTVLYPGFTNLPSRQSQLNAWSASHKMMDVMKVEMISNRFGIGLVIVSVKGNKVQMIQPSGKLSRYMYVLYDGDNYCLLMTGGEGNYQALYTSLHLIRLEQ